MLQSPSERSDAAISERAQRCCDLWCARSATRPLVLLSGARVAPHARAGARAKQVQPHARKFVELTDFGTIRSHLSSNKEITHESWRTRFETPEGVDQADGRRVGTRETRDASAVCKHPNPDAEGSDATVTPRDHQQTGGSARLVCLVDELVLEEPVLAVALERDA